MTPRQRKQKIDIIRKMLNPELAYPFAKYFIQSREAPGMWSHEGKLYTKKECLAMKARHHYFIVIKRKPLAEIHGA